MPRRILVLSLILLYSLSVVGLPLHYHYCKGELKHITVFVRVECHDEDTRSDFHACCGVQKSECSTAHILNQCCDDDTQWLHESVPAVCQSNWQDGDSVPQSLAVVPWTETTDVAESGMVLFVTTTDPPPATPLYLSNCALIYYG